MKMICAGCGKEMISVNRPHSFLFHTILNIAEMAYQSEVVETKMEGNLVGPGKEYADKDDWESSWFKGIMEPK